MLIPPHPHLGYFATNDSDPAAAAGTSVTSSSSQNAYGTATQIHAGFSFATSFVLLTVTNTGINNANRGTYVDIGIGPDSGSVTWIAEKLGGAGTAPGIGINFFMPLRIPPNTPVWARHQNAQVSAAAGVQISVMGGNMNPGTLPHIGQVVPLGATASSTTGTAITIGSSGSEGAWTEIVASTTEDYAGLMVSWFCTNTSHSAGTSYTFDIGLGANGSEFTVGENVSKFVTVSANEQQAGYCLPTFLGVPTGSRISVRGCCHSSAAANSSVIVYGFKH